MKTATIGYTIREAAEIRGVSTKTVLRQIWKKEVSATLKGKVFIIPPLELKKIKVRPSHRPKKVNQSKTL